MRDFLERSWGSIRDILVKCVDIISQKFYYVPPRYHHYFSKEDRFNKTQELNKEALEVYAGFLQVQILQPVFLRRFFFFSLKLTGKKKGQTPEQKFICLSHFTWQSLTLPLTLASVGKIIMSLTADGNCLQKNHRTIQAVMHLTVWWTFILQSGEFVKG